MLCSLKRHQRLGSEVTKLIQQSAGSLGERREVEEEDEEEEKEGQKAKELKRKRIAGESEVRRSSRGRPR